VTGSLISMLGTARLTGCPAPLPAWDVPLGEAYGLQKALFAERGVPLAGWKIGLTGEGIRKALGADSPAAGQLAPADIVRAPERAAIGRGEFYVEGELIFEIGERLSPTGSPFTPAQVANVVAGLHVGIELVTSRFASTDLPLGLLVADNCMADRLLVGDKVATGWEDRFADMAMTLRGPGDAITCGATSAVMGNPLLAVVWLADWLAEREMALEAGQLISSGTCTGVTAVAPGDRVSVDLAGLGGAGVEFTAGS